MDSSGTDLFEDWKKKQAALLELRKDFDKVTLEKKSWERKARGDRQDAHFYADEAKGRTKEVMGLRTALKRAWADLEDFHVERCTRMGLACPACEAQGRIEEVL